VRHHVRSRCVAADWTRCWPRSLTGSWCMSRN
jgi:hypothetical protein